MVPGSGTAGQGEQGWPLALPEVDGFPASPLTHSPVVTETSHFPSPSPPSAFNEAPQPPSSYASSSRGRGEQGQGPPAMGMVEGMVVGTVEGTRSPCGTAGMHPPSHS